MADLTSITSWTSSDVQHFARRAGFGISPETAAQLATQAPGATVDAWVDGTGLDQTLFANILANRADPVAEKHLANYCEYFEFVRREFVAPAEDTSREAKARDTLKKLLGD